jgi:hypothetical protein
VSAVQLVVSSITEEFVWFVGTLVIYDIVAGAADEYLAVRKVIVPTQTEDRIVASVAGEIIGPVRAPQNIVARTANARHRQGHPAGQ